MPDEQRPPQRSPSPGTICALLYICVCLSLGWGHFFPLHMRPLPGQWVRHNATTWEWVMQADLSYPYHPSTVKNFPGLVGWCFLAPVFACALAAIAGYDRSDLLAFWKGYGIAMSTCVFCTNFGKNYVGRFRPSFYSRCDADLFSVSPDSDPLCRGDPDVTHEDRKSFPSGHASYAFCAAAFIALYLQGKARRYFQATQTSRGVPRQVQCGSWGTLSLGALWEWFATVPWIACGAFIAVTRVRDNRHHAADVVAGGLLGAALGVWGYLMYYPMPHGDGAVDRRLGHDDDSVDRRHSRQKPLLRGAAADGAAGVGDGDAS